MTVLRDAQSVIHDAISARLFPAATVEAGSSAGPLWSEAFGTGLQTPFDLASLTKVIATTTVVMELVRNGALRLDEPVAACFGEWRGADRGAVTVRDLLEHASGLPARLVDAPPSTRREFEHDICSIALEYAPRTGSIYSDLGFILLGFIAERLGGGSLAAQFPPAVDSAIDDVPAFGVPDKARQWAAPTEPMDRDPRRGRRLIGVVHDDYAWRLGGAAGHAGLFANASGVGAFARMLLRSTRGAADLPVPFAPEITRLITARSLVPGSSRALGWDTMLPTSSCGIRMSVQAFGHVGYTGTSLWIDPQRDRYFVLLTNRVFGGGTLDQMRTVRRAFHDALGDL